MSLEEEVFAGYAVDEDKLPDCGFSFEGDTLTSTFAIPEEGFDVILTYDGAFHGRILDRATGEEYVNFRREGATGYSAEVREQFRALLLDLRERCARNLFFHGEQARRICAYIMDAYGATPEFLWPSIPSYAAFRQEGSKKWYAVMGSVPLKKVIPASDDAREVEVINVKVDSSAIREILSRPGYYPAFHMNKKCWVSIILNGSLTDDEIHRRIAASYESV